MPSGPALGRGNGGGGIAPQGRSMMDRVEGRSLFERIDGGAGRGPPAARRRSESPRRSDVRGPTPDGIDRYVPTRGAGRPTRRSRSRSPIRQRGGRRDGGRRPAVGRQDSERAREGGGAGGRRGRDGDGRLVVGGRPRKTADELDAEMADYWGSGPGPAAETKAADGFGAVQTSTIATTSAVAPTPVAADAVDDDIDMIL